MIQHVEQVRIWNRLFEDEELLMYNYGTGREIEPNTFITGAGTDAGVPHHCTDEAELRALLGVFTILDADLVEYRDDDNHLHSHWTVLIEK